jgi:hypothetical protein
MTYLMNGTNAVGQMNGTNAVGLNGTNNVNLNGTADVGGNYSELTLNGTPCSQLHPDEIMINGYGMNGTQEEIDAFKLGVLYGDSDAVSAYESGNLNGFFSMLKERKDARRADRQSNQDARQGEREAKRLRREARFKARQERLAAGGGFFQQAGSALQSVAPGLAAKLAGETESDLNDLGVNPDEETLMSRVAQQAGAGVRSSESEGGWWSSQPTATKAAIIGGGVLVAYLAAKQFGLIGKKGKRKK